MIDFKRDASLCALTPINDDNIKSIIQPLLSNDENIISMYKNASEDYVLFTNKQAIAIELYGKDKKEFTFMPYSKIEILSVTADGKFDSNPELKLCFSGIGSVSFEFSGSVDISKIYHSISEYSLK